MMRLIKSFSHIALLIVVISTLIGVKPLENRTLAAEALPDDGWNMLIDDNFDTAGIGTNAAALGYTVYKPMYAKYNAGSLIGDAYVAAAPGRTSNSLYVYDNYNSVSNVVYSNKTRIVKTFAKQEGIVVAEVSFMQPGPQRERTKVLNLLSSSGDYIARITADPGQAQFVFDAKTGPDNISPYEPNKWYDIKLVVDIVNDQVMVYVNGSLCFSKQPTVEVRSAGTTTSEKIRQNIAMLEIITAGESPNPVNALYVDNIKVYAKPPAVSPQAPTGVTTYPRDKAIDVEWTPAASARSNNVYITDKPGAADSDYVKVISKYNKKFVPTDYVSITKLGTSSGSPALDNGKTYYVKVTQNTRLLASGTDTEFESPLSLSQAVAVTPAPIMPLDSAASSVIGNVYVNDILHSAGWSVHSNLAVGSMPYGDTANTITKLPAGYAGADWIRTANASNAYSVSDALASFTVTDDADVMVAVSRDTKEANISWLSTWTKNGDVIELDGGAALFDVYKKSFAANSVVALNKIGQSDSMGYFIIVRARSLLLDSFEFQDSDGNPITGLAPGTDTIATAELTNNTTADHSFVVILALYDADHRMVAYSSASATAKPGEKRALHTGIRVPHDLSGYQAKAFIWDSLQGMKPLANSISIQ